MGFMEVVKSRYSCKKYDAAQITKEQLETILEAGRLAPTAKTIRNSISMLFSLKRERQRSIA